jgi:hypothetical protein
MTCSCVVPRHERGTHNDAHRADALYVRSVGLLVQILRIALTRSTCDLDYSAACTPVPIGQLTPVPPSPQ